MLQAIIAASDSVGSPLCFIQTPKGEVLNCGSAFLDFETGVVSFERGDYSILDWQKIKADCKGKDLTDVLTIISIGAQDFHVGSVLIENGLKLVCGDEIE